MNTLLAYILVGVLEERWPKEDFDALKKWLKNEFDLDDFERLLERISHKTSEVKNIHDSD